MPSDLAIDNNGDLIFAGNRDLMMVSGTAQIEQRIRIRLLLPLDASAGDEDVLGSDLHAALRLTTTDARALDDLALHVQDVLAVMTDIIVHDVKISASNTGNVELTVLYSMVSTDEETEIVGSSDDEVESLVLTLGVEE